MITINTSSNCLNYTHAKLFNPYPFLWWCAPPPIALLGSDASVLSLGVQNILSMPSCEVLMFLLGSSFAFTNVYCNLAFLYWLQSTVGQNLLSLLHVGVVS